MTQSLAYYYKVANSPLMGALERAGVPKSWCVNFVDAFNLTPNLEEFTPKDPFLPFKLCAYEELKFIVLGVCPTKDRFPFTGMPVHRHILRGIVSVNEMDQTIIHLAKKGVLFTNMSLTFNTIPNDQEELWKGFTEEFFKKANSLGIPVFTFHKKSTELIFHHDLNFNKCVQQLIR